MIIIMRDLTKWIEPQLKRGHFNEKSERHNT